MLLCESINHIYIVLECPCDLSTRQLLDNLATNLEMIGHLKFEYRALQSAYGVEYSVLVNRDPSTIAAVQYLSS